MKKKDIKVSIICNAYNHELYIKDALDGFLMQKTNFEYEVLVHDDASTDKTADIIREYEKKHPEIIKPIYQTENQWSRRDATLREFQVPRAKGEYIAFCEGDDYWTDANKLQKQYELMEENKHINISGHRVNHVNSETKEKIGERRPAKKTGIIPPEVFIEKGGGIISTNSLFYRREIMLNPPRFFKNLGYDFSLQILGAIPNGLLYIDESMSSYRKFSKKSWTTIIAKDNNLYVSFKNEIINMLREFDEDTDYKYRTSVQKSIYREEYDVLTRFKDYKGMMEHPYYRIINMRYRIRPFIRRYLRL